MSFGSLSRLYKACHPDIKRGISRRIDINDVQFSSWLHSLSYIRNVCAHHSRLWNREIAVKPSLPRPSPAWPYRVPSTDRLYCILVILRHCLVRLSPQCKWRDRLISLFDSHPQIDMRSMHFPENWRASPPWN
jgi:abortive infection bacteriophage resistance protein